MIWWQQLLFSCSISLLAGSLTGLYLGRRFAREKQDALRELAKVLGETHEQTSQQLIDLQRIVYAAKDLGEVKDYLRAQSSEAFVRLLQPVHVVKLPEDV